MYIYRALQQDGKTAVQDSISFPTVPSEDDDDVAVVVVVALITAVLLSDVEEDGGEGKEK